MEGIEEGQTGKSWHMHCLLIFVASKLCLSAVLKLNTTNEIVARKSQGKVQFIDSKKIKSQKLSRS